MRKYWMVAGGFLAVAVLLVIGACAETVAPSDAGPEVRQSIGFETGVTGFNTSLTSTVPTPTARSGNSFLGRFTQEEITYDTGLSGSVLSVALDLYVIGSWDGLGRQAQQGTFGPNRWQLAARCNGQTYNIFTTSFSNQKTVQQNYPRAHGDPGGAKAWSGSYAVGSLGFGPPEVHVPLFTSAGDSEYHIARTWDATVCGSSHITVVFRTQGENWQTLYDESWGLDNVAVTVE